MQSIERFGVFVTKSKLYLHILFMLMFVCVLDSGFTEVDKRKGVRPVPYPCNGYDHLPRCLHGGRGPRKTNDEGRTVLRVSLPQQMDWA